MITVLKSLTVECRAVIIINTKTIVDNITGEDEKSKKSQRMFYFCPVNMVFIGSRRLQEVF